MVLPQHNTDDKGGTGKPAKTNYVALSYMWDYMTPSLLPSKHWSRKNQEKEIYCNGASLTVKSNLYAALHQLRHETESTILWTDAICINQKDDDEKTSQVRLMRKIYALAEKTVVWLGQETYVSAQGFKAIRFLADIMRSSCLADSTNQEEVPHQSLNLLQSFINPNRYL